uniref:CAP-Gly domain-containing protein n=1 Tax=Auxenochlorella protothecoides TaxID=3075 RepID=A0A1D2ABR8_AUXPR
MAALTGDLRALRDYVMTPGDMQNQSDSTVLLSVTHSNLKARFMEIRFDRHMTVSAVKDKLCFHTGSAPSAMTLSLRAAGGGASTILQNDKKLGYYSPQDRDTLHVEDLDPTSASRNGWLEDTSKVEKYVMSDEDYNRRDGTYRKFKETKLQEDPTWTLEKEMEARSKARGATGPAPQGPAPDDSFQEEPAAGIAVGTRCEVQGGRRGTVRFVGRCPSLPAGFWIGVEYDEPVGKNDGSARGHRCFTCAPGYGSFVRPDLVKVGDFPAHDFAFSDDDEI